MKFRKIMLVTLLLLAVLTIGAASAAEVADGTGNETVIESPADYVIGTSEGNDDLSVNPKDFNVTFLADEVDIKDENAKVLRFYWPDDVGFYDSVTVEVENGSAPWYQKVQAQHSRMSLSVSFTFLIRATIKSQSSIIMILSLRNPH